MKKHILMQICIEYSKMASCFRNRVGAILVKEGHIVSSGYNGLFPNQEPINCETKCDINKSCSHTIHAEINAIGFAAKNGIITRGCDLYVTMFPCDHCCKIISIAGIRRVYYLYEYHSSSNRQHLENLGIIFEKIELN